MPMPLIVTICLLTRSVTPSLPQALRYFNYTVEDFG